MIQFPVYNRIEGFLKVLLVISLIFLGFSLSEINWSVVAFEERTEGIYFQENIGETLSVLYGASDGEYKVCLHGLKQQNNYYITKITLAKTEYADAGMLITEVCKNSLGELHSHTNGNCALSVQDKKSFRSLDTPDGFIEIVQCRKNTFRAFNLPTFRELEVYDAP